eukprot:s191_g30.t1
MEEEDEHQPDLTLRVWWEGRCSGADGSWVEMIDDQWMSRLPGSSMARTFGLLFPQKMIGWMQAQFLEEEAQMVKWTYLELSVYWLKRHPDLLPVPSAGGLWTDGVSVSGCSRISPTVAATAFLMRRFFSLLPDFLGFPVAQCRDISLLPLDVHTPQTGVHLSLSKVVVTETHQILRDFVRHRPIRVVNDLSRPLR